MGYATLNEYANASLGFQSNADSQAKQLYIAKQVKAAAPDLPVWAGTAWDITLCGPSMPFEPFHSCLMEVDEQMRASCGYDDATGSYSKAASPDCQLLTCNGKVIKRADNHTIHGFEKPAGRAAWAPPAAESPAAVRPHAAPRSCAHLTRDESVALNRVFWTRQH